MADQPFLLGPLERAAASLATALAAPESEFVRDSIVKRFEFTYELSWKLMRRHFAWAALEPAPETRKDLFARPPVPGWSTIPRPGSPSTKRGT
jgi:hypothetical protein